MESTPELQHLLSDLQSLSSVLKRRWKPAIAGSGIVFGGIVLLTILQGPSYEASGKVLLEKRNSSSSLTESGKEIGELSSVGSSDPVSNEMEIIRSLPIAQRTINELNLKDTKGDPLEPTAFVEQKLTVEKVKGTDILKVTYKSKSPQEAAGVTNKLMNVYIENSILVDRSKALMTGQFVSQQLPATEAAVRKAEDSIRRFKEINQITDLDDEKKSIEVAVSGITQKISDSHTALRSSISRSETLKNKLAIDPNTAVQVSSLSQNSSIQEAISELQQAENQLAIAHDRYGDIHPIIIDLTNKVTTLRSSLRNRVGELVGNQVNLNKSQLQVRGVKQALLDDFVKLQIENIALNTQINSLGYEKALYLRRANIVPKLEQKQRELERQLEASQSTYSMLLKKSQEMRITVNQSGGNARVIEYATTPKKFRIKPVLLKLSLGIFLGGLIGLAVTFLLEVRDKSIKTIKEARDRFGYTLLGIIPCFEFSGHNNSSLDELDQFIPQLVVQKFPSSSISEAYSMLHSNLRFMNTDTELRTIVVASCVPGEGKSTVAANLALTMVKQGLKVLLVDGDMRRPIQHRIWEVPQLIGLSDVIVSQADFSKAVHQKMEGLSILTAGVAPPNPGALLDSKKMESLLKQFSEKFDFVIIDTPPLLSANDPRILGRMADGLILVTRPGVVNSDDAAAAKELLTQLEDKVLGMVVNGVTPEHESHSFFYYTKEYQSTFSEKAQKIEV
jgi:polysaccharide biosynthesis transport protein